MTDANKNILVAEKIRKIYTQKSGDIIALDTISLSIKKKSISAIVGPSGTGKSTLLNIAGLIQNPTSGNIYINDENITHFSDKDRSILRRNLIGFLFQDGGMIENMTILENIRLPLIYRGISPQKRRKKALDLLGKVGLHNMEDRTPNQLSGGELQRASFARSLISDPQLLICDEPTAPLDKETSKEIIKLILWAVEKGTSILIATHDQMIMDIADTITTLSKK